MFTVLLDREQKKKSSKTLRKRKMDGDFPHQKGDYKHKEEMIVEEEEKLADSEVVDEFQFVRHYARLYATFFRNKKPKHQENQQQNIQTQHVAHSRTKQKADKHRRAMDLSTLRVAINEDNNRTPLLTVYSVDPPVPREPICASQCGRLFSCGTRSAPEYRNIEDYLSTDDNPDGSKDNTTAIMMDKNQNKAFLGSRHNGVKSRGEWIMTRFVTVMASIAMAQCVS
ncbi:hypothetical protein FBU30_001023 [Linnemannia zychae]|nr:hypothetical protein FBU30_001023 [Linnemannia zychae]